MTTKKKQRSWVTSLFGALAIIAGGLTTAGVNKDVTAWSVKLAPIFAGLGLHFARDNNKSSEDVGVK